MRVRALLLPLLLFPLQALAQEWCGSPICARFEGTDLIRMRAPGRFEVTFSKREGFGDQVYDLQADPGKLRDLGAGFVENGILWTKVEEVGNSVTYFANNATSLELLEANGVRVRARDAGQHQQYGLPGMPWDALGYTQTFTVYATGEVYVEYDLIASRDIQINTFDMIVKSTGNWGSNGTPGDGQNEAHCVGQYGLNQPYAPQDSSFAMISSNGSHYFADILMAFYKNTYNGSYWNEGFSNGDYRCGLYLGDFNPTLHTGTSHLRLMMRIAEDMNDPTSASKYADAYRLPDTGFSVTQGTKVLNSPGDRDGDGFDETQGDYVLRRQAGQGVAFELHANRPRMNPAFAILDWNDAVPIGVYVDSVLQLANGDRVRSSKAGSTLIVQLLGEFPDDVSVMLAAPAVQVPALPWSSGAALAAALGASGARRIAKKSRASSSARS
jgi:hypothetical protein